MKYIIQPLNEGQELNYTEVKEFKGLAEVKAYVSNMCKLLGQALPEGLISVSYEEYNDIPRG